MFELSQEDLCHWRKKHNQIEGFREMPNHKNLEQSNVQKEVVTNKEKEVIEEDAQGDQPDKPNQKEDLSIQEMFKILLVNSRRQEENLMELISSIKEDNRLIHENIKKLEENSKEQCRKQSETSKLMNETLNSTSKGIIVSPNIEENIQKIKKIWRKKIINTKEEMVMRKGGLILSLIHI